MGGSPEMISGILNIDKPRGLTSHDVVNRLRRAAGQRRVGHAGTLDPMATGVLLICLGQATRVAEYLMNAPKRYRARVMLGIATDTYDAEGTPISEQPCPPFTRQQLEDHLHRFLGVIEQVPPMYSAVKVGGQPLYRLARRGVTVERKPRRVEIYAIELLSWDPPFLQFIVECSPGTYIRSIAHDLGRVLGCGAHLTDLTRLASGKFRLEDAHPLEAVEAAFAAGEWRRIVHPLDEALAHFPAVTLDEEKAKRVRHGQPVELAQVSPDRTSQEGSTTAPLCRVYSPEGTLLALLYQKDGSNQWWPRKVFVAN